ncbi:unnamed protein product, partial [Bubo scandiacus]
TPVPRCPPRDRHPMPPSPPRDRPPVPRCPPRDRPRCLVARPGSGPRCRATRPGTGPQRTCPHRHGTPEAGTLAAPEPAPGAFQPAPGPDTGTALPTTEPGPELGASLPVPVSNPDGATRPGTEPRYRAARPGSGSRCRATRSRTGPRRRCRSPDRTPVPRPLRHGEGGGSPPGRLGPSRRRPRLSEPGSAGSGKLVPRPRHGPPAPPSLGQPVPVPPP